MELEGAIYWGIWHESKYNQGFLSVGFDNVLYFRDKDKAEAVCLSLNKNGKANYEVREI